MQGQLMFKLMRWRTKSRLYLYRRRKPTKLWRMIPTIFMLSVFMTETLTVAITTLSSKITSTKNGDSSTTLESLTLKKRKYSNKLMEVVDRRLPIGLFTLMRKLLVSLQKPTSTNSKVQLGHLSIKATFTSRESQEGLISLLMTTTRS